MGTAVAPLTSSRRLRTSGHRLESPALSPQQAVSLATHTASRVSLISDSGGTLNIRQEAENKWTQVGVTSF